MPAIERVLYTGKTSTSAGGRDGTARSSDGRLDIQFSSPGSGGTGTTPEQLFGACWSACFIGAIGLAAKERKVALPSDLAVDTEVDLGMAGSAFLLQVRIDVSMPGVPRGIAQALIDIAWQICPISKATRGNINVVIRLMKQSCVPAPLQSYPAPSPRVSSGRAM
jgi:Ohr subfamily peroxiredoxin